MPRDFASERLWVRKLGGRDEALFCRIYTDPALMRHVAAPMSDAVARSSFDKACAGVVTGTWPWWLWVMQETSTGSDIGLLGLRPRKGGQIGEIGAMLLAQAQGKGLAAEAITALVDIAFDLPGVQRLQARHASANGAATGLMRKLGFASAGVGDDLHWQLTRVRWSDWQRSRQGPVATFAMVGNTD